MYMDGIYNISKLVTNHNNIIVKEITSPLASYQLFVSSLLLGFNFLVLLVQSFLIYE